MSSSVSVPSRPGRLSDSFPAWKIIRPFAFGGAAGCMATVVVQPIDMVKVRDWAES